MHTGRTTDLLEKAAATARDLPPGMQDEIARVVLALADDEQPAYQSDPDEAVELNESEAAARRGDFATDHERRVIRAKHGL